MNSMACDPSNSRIKKTLYAYGPLNPNNSLDYVNVGSYNGNGWAQPAVVKKDLYPRNSPYLQHPQSSGSRAQAVFLNPVAGSECASHSGPSNNYFGNAYNN